MRQERGNVFVLKKIMKAKDSSGPKIPLGVVGFPMLLGLLIWYAYWMNLYFGLGWKQFGIRPRKLEGLSGVLFSPFLHGDVGHLWNNTLPLMVLSACLFYFYRSISWKVIGYGILISGVLTWTIADTGNHIGASGLIYVMASFIFFKGIMSRNYRLVALSMLVVFLYGSMVWYIFPVKVGISWEGHLAGAITGVLFALFFRSDPTQRPTYAWESPTYEAEDDAFMRHFDEEGNFIPESELKRRMELEEESDSETLS